MKTLVLYYSYSGSSKNEAESYAKKNAADIEEVKDQKRPSTLGAYTLGGFNSMRFNGTPITPIQSSLNDYDKFVVFGPIWAGSPAPAVIALLEQLPNSKHAEVYLLSGSGNSKAKAKVEKLLNTKNIALDVFQDLKAPTK